MAQAYIESTTLPTELAQGLAARRNMLSSRPSGAEHGFSHPLYQHVGRIEQLVQVTGAKRVLDFGAADGKEYDARVVELPGQAGKRTVVDFWGVEVVHCYDPAQATFCNVPRSSFDGVLCLNLLEYCPGSHATSVVNELFSLATGFVFVAVGPDAPHPRVAQAWLDVMASASRAFPKVIWEAWVTEAGSTSRPERRLANFNWNA